MSVPAVAVVGARFMMERSATRWAVVVAVAKLLAGLVSSVALVAATVAVLTIGPVATGLMCTVMVKGWVALGASVPKVQVTVPAVLVHPGSVAATVAVLTIGPVATGLMCTVMVKGWVALGASVPKVQVTVPAVLVHPALAETKLTCTGSTSGTGTRLEVEEARLV